MKINIRNITETAFACDALILPLHEGEGLKPYDGIDKSLNGLIGDVISSEEFTGKHNEVCLLHTGGAIKPDRILLIGLGKRKDLSHEKLRRAGGKAVSYLGNLKIKNIALSTGVNSPIGLSPLDFIEGGLLADYSFTGYKKEQNLRGVQRLTILSGEDLQQQVRWIETTASAAHFARDLVNTPSNDMTPSALVKAARSLKNVSVRVIERKEAERLGMGAYLSVAKGSNEPPKFIVITYKGRNVRPVALIGKSITFDSGGISIKPGEGMEKMKYDMAGGAAVLGTIKAASELKMPVHIIGILPAAENLPGGSASKPGDVVRTISGKSIEIISTDAEGRLALADAIEYAKRFKPSAIIDIATLTGACSITFGNEAIAMMGNDEALLEKMKNASEETCERVWQMPLFEEYKDYIKSDIADLKNSGGRSGSLISSAYFLSEFANDAPWLHLDIAGTAWTDKDRPYIPKGATGIGVRLLLGFLKQHVA
ncbi:MAG: leucyl aminopeptidase [Nitrospiraceae bacterium]|nr:MAG: leucyl aminopeptidase [Nitrospiraceae bacterium]